jgi:DNA-binding transcriptional regulator YiaG
VRNFTGDDLEKFLVKHDLSDSQFAFMLDVTKLAVQHWLFGRRKVPSTVIKLIQVFEKKPELINDFL